MLIVVLSVIFIEVFLDFYGYCFETIYVFFIVILIYDFCIDNKDPSYIRRFE